MPLRRIRADRAAAPALLLGYSHVVADGSPQCRGAVIASLGTSALHFFASRELSFASRQLDRATASLGRPQGLYCRQLYPACASAPLASMSRTVGT